MSCNFSTVGPFITSELTGRVAVLQAFLHFPTGLEGGTKVLGDSCSSAVATADEEMGPINLYDIYVEACLGQGRDGRHFGNGGLSLTRRCVRK